MAFQIDRALILSRSHQHGIAGRGRLNTLLDGLEVASRRPRWANGDRAATGGGHDQWQPACNSQSCRYRQ